VACPRQPDALRWAEQLEKVAGRIGPRFLRSEPRRQALAYLQGLLSPVERKNSWQLAEQAGDPGPHRFQHLLGRAAWSADAVRDDLQAYVLQHLADPEGVLIVDETGFLKKGDRSVGVQRQYSGTAGRIENCQIGVFLAYQSARGHAFLDRALYLPEDWAGDPLRREAANVPEEIRFATKPVLARQMIQRALDQGVPARWVTGDSVYGNDGKLRLWLEEKHVGHVLGVSGNHFVVIGWKQQKVSSVAAEFLPEAWQRLSAGAGSKGPRWYDWAAVQINGLEEEWRRWVLIRRQVENPQELAYYRAFAPEGTALEDLVAVAGKRWAVEECFATAKGEVGLDQYEVRSGTGWHRHITLSLLAHAYLTVVRAQALGKTPKKENSPPRPKRINSPERAGNPASTVVPRMAENGGTVIGPGLVPVAAQTPSPGTVLPLPTPHPVRLNELQL
jgi:SRSO17 transposase